MFQSIPLYSWLNGTGFFLLLICPKFCFFCFFLPIKEGAIAIPHPDVYHIFSYHISEYKARSISAIYIHVTSSGTLALNYLF